MGEAKLECAEAEKAYYQKFIDDIRSGNALTEAQIRHHVAMQNRATRSGVEIGQTAPDFRLQDQTGAIRSRDELLGPNGLVVVFSRTVVWCPYCRNHIVEADGVAPFLLQHGVNLVSITPDGVELHKAFAKANQLRHSLLADPERQAIRGFGVLNENIPKDVVGQRPDVPFAGYFVLDENGVVVDKTFLTDYQFRQSPSVAIARRFGWRGRPAVEARTAAFHARFALSTNRGFAGHQLGFQCLVQPVMPWGERDGAVTVEVKLSGPLIEGEQTASLMLAGTIDRGGIEVNGVVPVRWSAPPDFERMKGLEHMRKGGLREGTYPLGVSVSISRDSGDGAAAPERLALEIPVDILAEVPSPIPLG